MLIFSKTNTKDSKLKILIRMLTCCKIKVLRCIISVSSCVYTCRNTTKVVFILRRQDKLLDTCSLHMQFFNYTLTCKFSLIFLISNLLQNQFKLIFNSINSDVKYTTLPLKKTNQKTNKNKTKQTSNTMSSKALE